MSKPRDLGSRVRARSAYLKLDDTTKLMMSEVVRTNDPDLEYLDDLLKSNDPDSLQEGAGTLAGNPPSK